MGTRAVYTFIDELNCVSVYKHWDGYPTWACRDIANALPLAWPLPRFEAEEFAAAFVAANKKGRGDIYLIACPKAPGGLAYRYEIRCPDGQLHVRIYSCADDDQPIFEGTLEDAQQFASTFN
ncbi:MAG: hypothetical protein ACRELG_21865 [Gemmataceae bacterium]